MKILRTLILFSVVFGLGYYTGQKPDVVKQRLRDLSGQVLENTIGYDQKTSLQRQMLAAKEGFLEGRAYLLENHFDEAFGEFERALRHLDQAVELDPDGPLAQKSRRLNRRFERLSKAWPRAVTFPLMC
jgi:tetratricopeptide (TPR) repeat protein